MLDLALFVFLATVSIQMALTACSPQLDALESLRFLDLNNPIVGKIVGLIRPAISSFSTSAVLPGLPTEYAR
jgi:hypothetical protein